MAPGGGRAITWSHTQFSLGADLLPCTYTSSIPHHHPILSIWLTSGQRRYNIPASADIAFQVLLGMSTGRAATRFEGCFLGALAAARATFGTAMAWASGSCSTRMDACTSTEDGPAPSYRTCRWISDLALCLVAIGRAARVSFCHSWISQSSKHLEGMARAGPEYFLVFAR